MNNKDKEQIWFHEFGHLVMHRILCKRKYPDQKVQCMCVDSDYGSTTFHAPKKAKEIVVYDECLLTAGGIAMECIVYNKCFYPTGEGAYKINDVSSILNACKERELMKKYILTLRKTKYNITFDQLLSKEEDLILKKIVGRAIGMIRKKPEIIKLGYKYFEENKNLKLIRGKRLNQIIDEVDKLLSKHKK